jgi:hypothetical protein
MIRLVLLALCLAGPAAGAPALASSLVIAQETPPPQPQPIPSPRPRDCHQPPVIS